MVFENFQVWEVDGEYIRDNIDCEFTNFGQHLRFAFIPTHEFWIDKEFSPGETRFFIDHMIVEWHLMSKGMAYDNAIDKADYVESKERAKSKLMLNLKGHTAETPKELHKKKVASYGNIGIWIVNGELVRDLYYVEFTEGGHHFVYDFVPINEIWLDDDLSSGEREYVLLHELHERNLMSKGMNYENAHRSSSIVEYKCRHNPDLLAVKIAEEIKIK